MEPLAKVYKDANSYYKHVHNRYPQSEDESDQSVLDYCQAIKELFLTKRATHFNTPGSVVQRLKDRKLDSKWMNHLFAQIIVDNWCEKVAMYTFIQSKLNVALSDAPPAPPIMPEELKAAFEDNIVGESVDYVYDCLNHIAKEWKTSSADYYYPGTAIIQTSGAGKSRSVVQIARSGKAYVVYYTFMDGTGFPQNAVNAPKFPLEKCDRNVFLSFYCACLEYISNSKVSPLDMVEECMKNVSSFWEGVRTLTLPIQNSGNIIDEWIINRIKTISEHLKSSRTAEQQLNVVFVFGEVRATLGGDGTTFEELRRAAMAFPADSGIAVVLIDTVSRVSNIIPAAKKDPFRRIQKGKRLFRPIYLLPTMDIFVSVHEKTGTVTLPELLKPEILYRLGRPLWKRSFLRTYPARTLYFAMGKLVCRDVSESIETKELDRYDCLAILRARLPFKVWRTDIASELIANHMSWCTFISEDRQFVSSAAVSEPILADAATEWMSGTARPRLYEILCEYIKMTANGAVDIGKSGEHVAALILLLARDDALLKLIAREEKKDRSKLLHHRMMTVKDFLSSFLAEQVVEQMMSQEEMKILMNGVISFSHFTCVDSTPKRSQLLQLMVRGAAILCKINQRGMDIVVPVLMPGKDGRFLLLPDRVTHISFQVKNLKMAISALGNKAIADKMRTDYVGLEAPQYPYLTVNMNLNEKHPSCSLIKTNNLHQLAIVVSGIHEALSPCLGDKENAFRKTPPDEYIHLTKEFDDYDDEADMNSEKVSKYTMTELLKVTQDSSSHLVSLLKVLLGRNVQPAGFQQADSKELDYVRSICSSFYLDKLKSFTERKKRTAGTSSE